MLTADENVNRRWLVLIKTPAQNGCSWSFPNITFINWTKYPLTWRDFFCYTLFMIKNNRIIFLSNVPYVVALIQVDESPRRVRDDEDDDHAGQQSHHGSVAPGIFFFIIFIFLSVYNFSRKVLFEVRIFFFSKQILT